MADAAPLLLELHRALGTDPAPCASDPEVWVGDDPADVAAAVLGCRSCPALAECGAYAEALRPSHGVWAGRSVGRRVRLDSTDDHDTDTDTDTDEQEKSA